MKISMDFCRVMMLKIFCKCIRVPRFLVNAICNMIYSILTCAKIDIDWRCAEIYNMSRIKFLGRFHSGPGLWLHPINKDSIIIIGNNVSISNWTHIAAITRVTISDGCLIGSKVHITDHYHGSSRDIFTTTPPVDRDLISKGPVFIGENVWIGDGVVILPNVNIGSGAIIGANSIVNKDVEPYSIVAGVPAKKIL